MTTTAPDVRGAVETREQAARPLTALQIAKQAIASVLNDNRPIIAKLLVGTGVSEETFVAQIANACRAIPDLWSCDPATILGAALRAAQLGLAPNDARNLCWIIPYKKVATFQLGYGGVMELARRAMPGLRFDGRPVYPNDEFDVDYGQPEPLTHRPAIVKHQERGGEAFAWYVRAVYPDGQVQIHILDREAVEYHRKFSKQPEGKMWKESYDAAALKSVVLDMKRWLPSSAQLVAGFGSDETVMRPEDLTDIDGEPAAGELTETTGGAEPPTVAEKEPAVKGAPGQEALDVNDREGNAK